MTEMLNYLMPYPLSERNPISSIQAWRSLRVFSFYRLVVASLFVILFFLNNGIFILSKYDPALYAVISTSYFILALIDTLCLSFRWPNYITRVQIQVFVDIVAFTLLVHASGGIESGIGILLAVTVAAGGLLVGGRYALLFAALASLAILTEQVYSDISGIFKISTYTYAGMLGVSFFTISLLTCVLGRRAEQSEAIAQQRGIDIANLQQLNEYIIQHLQSGIVILDNCNHIVMMNDSACRFFRIDSVPDQFEELSPQLSDYHQTWVSNPNQAEAIFTSNENSEVQIRFTKLDKSQGAFHMILLEDTSLNNQRIQQSKLASLGRLTASIAHEIRNPLEAISHAGQLLAECPSLGEQDRRLTEIIKEHTNRVNNVIENVLQLSRRRTPSRCEKFSLKPWLLKFMEDFKREYGLSESPFEFKMSADDILVRLDSSHLKQILDNICSNALKHGSQSDAKINVRVFRCNQTPQVEVIDNGPGISQEIARQIFEPFFTTSTTGTGLGLYIAKELAELNQARLDYEPTTKGGCCFRICLPDAEKAVIAV